MKHKKAFTLVELIVVITILSILSALSYISFQGYIQSARNATQVSNMRLIEKSPSLYVVKNIFYPTPSDSEYITINNGGIVNLWNNGTIGSSVIRVLGNMSEVPVSPLTQLEFGYSVTLKKTEYQLLGYLEPNAYDSLGSPVYASDYTPAVIGNYNKMYVVGSDNKIYSAPSLFSTGTVLDNELAFNTDNEVVSYEVAALKNSSH
ncbi:prepilin-type N-terminal cleavage/methylation domain-containing protein [Candidatus Gracilibacteria bacterium]|nr:prepilin-type N-terminal cleavage/methylation domain-containing protein [Candidatus Gracilibacteria bacterium]